MPLYRSDSLFDFSKTIAAPLLEAHTYPWEALPFIKEYILQLGPTLPADEFDSPQPEVWIAKDATVAPSASISGPCIIDKGAEIRHCAFIRGSVIIGKGAVVGNSTELKNTILFDKVQVPHFNYAGDSILGYKAHMGAGVIASNMKSDKSNVVVRIGDEAAQTGLRKMGAILGDYVEVGCNSVLCPGTIVGKNSNVYPTSCVRGGIPANCIFKGPESIVEKKKKK